MGNLVESSYRTIEVNATSEANENTSVADGGGKYNILWELLILSIFKRMSWRPLFAIWLAKECTHLSQSKCQSLPIVVVGVNRIGKV